jgi:flagellar biosynthesis protein FliQ
MAIVAVIFVVAAPWMMDQLSAFTIHLFEGITEFVRN